MAAKQRKTAITPTRADDYPEWYQQVVRAADLAENAPVRGCMVIKPWGYHLWENIQRVLDGMFKELGHQNAYFPLLIPKSFLEKEAEHVEGFAKECAVVTHSRLEQQPDGSLAPASPLDEPLIVRPTSETIIGDVFAKWIQSYRDLPLLINQWANIVRWEMRTRLFLRTAEFLWQEGHTAHATEKEAVEHTRLMLETYARFCEEYMAMPVIKGEKTASERFPGALSTLCIEPMMQDRKALQAGTSHFLGQNFSKAASISFLDQDGSEQHAWTTSWGVSTRLIGGLIMTHGDDDGLIVPPRLAPEHIVILPVLRKDGDEAGVLDACHQLAAELQEIRWHDEKLRVRVDARDIRGGEKAWQWVKKGVPLRVEIGPRDLANGSVFVARRDTGEKSGQDRSSFLGGITHTLDSIQQNLFDRALSYRNEHTRKIDDFDEFRAFFTPKNAAKPEIHGGFALSHWNGSAEVEERLQKELKVTIRCIPFDRDPAPGKCIVTGEPSAGRVVFGKSY